jgi:formyl-CoA transferase
VRDIFEDAQVRARRNVEEIASPLGGLLHMAGIVPRLTATPGSVRHAGPLTVGQDNEEIYGGRLGLSRQALEDLASRGVV